MRGRTIALLTALLVVGTAVASVLASGGSDAAAQASAGSRVRVFDREGPYTRMIDVGSRGLRAGDSIFEVHPLLDPETRERVGRSVTHVRIVRTLPKDDFLGTLDCTVELPAGDITFYGVIRLSELEGGTVLPLTGGTGAYVGVEGTVTGQGGELGGKPGAYLTFDIAAK
jgi:hypothetical protein